MSDTYIVTDQADYMPGSTATVTGFGFDSGDYLVFSLRIVNADGTLSDPVTWLAANPVNADGTISTSFFVNPIYANATVQLTALEVTAGADGGLSTTDFTAVGPTATTLFTDSVILASTNAHLNMTGDGALAVTQGSLATDSTGGQAIFVADDTFKTQGASHDFAEIQNTGTEQGFNQNSLLDTKNGPAHNYALPFIQLDHVNVDGTPDTTGAAGYYAFHLTVNQQTNAYLSLDALKIYQAGSASLAGFIGFGANFDLTGATLDYNLGDNWIALKDLAQGHDTSSYEVLIPDTVITADKGAYVYLYSEFGAQGNSFGMDAQNNPVSGSANGGFEAWSTPGAAPPAGTPDLTITKDTLVGATSVAGQTVLAGTPITWVYDVTNTGTVTLDARPTVTDNQGVTPTYVSGDTNNNGKFDPGETWIYSASGTAIAGNYSNIGEATDTYGNINLDQTATSGYFGVTPGITLDKQLTSNGQAWVDGATSVDTPPTVLVGDAVNFQAIATDTTTGGLPVTSVKVTDANGPDLLGGGPTIASGIPATYSGNTMALAGLHTDTATINGMVTDSAGDTAAVSASDSAAYYGVTPGITVDKQVSGTQGAATHTWQDTGTNTGTTLGTAPTILVGDTVSFQAIVTNTTDGNLGQTGVSVDDVGGPALTSSSTTLAANGGISTFTGSTTALAGLNTDTATVNGTVTDSFNNTAATNATDQAGYYGVTPGITIDKQLTSNGQAWIDAGTNTGLTAATAPTILIGKMVNFQAVVTNTTDGHLGQTGVSVTDVGGPALTGGSTLAADGGAGAFTGSITALAGLNTDTATVNGTVTDSFNNTAATIATDQAGYYGVTPGITVDKQVSGSAGPTLTWLDTGTNTGVTAATAPTILVGKTVNFQAVVTNTTDGHLGQTGVSVTDVGGPALTGGSTLAADGGAGAFTGSTTALAGLNTDTATVNGTVTDSFGNTAHTTATDQAAYYGAQLGITIDKQVSVDGGAHWLDVGNGNVTDNTFLNPGSPAEFRVVVSNTGNVTETVSVKDAADTAAINGINFTFGGASSVSLAAGAGLTSAIITTSALHGAHTDTATATATFTDSFGNLGTATASDSANYNGFTAGTAGLTIGYWYNHPTVGSGAGQWHESYWKATAASTAVPGVMLGDVDGSFWAAHNTAATAFVGNAPAGDLFIPGTAAIQLINASQTATDTRQILLSQALAAQLNIDNGDRDPGYSGTPHIPDGKDLIHEAVVWLTGPGNVDTNHDGILETGGGGAPTFEYNNNTTVRAFTSTALTSNSGAWQNYVSYASVDYHPTGIGTSGTPGGSFSADGEGLKNALQAFDQNHLVTDSLGHGVAWNASGAVGGPYTDFKFNNGNDFWAVLHDQVPANSSLLHGIA